MNVKIPTSYLFSIYAITKTNIKSFHIINIVPPCCTYSGVLLIYFNQKHLLLKTAIIC